MLQISTQKRALSLIQALRNRNVTGSPNKLYRLSMVRAAQKSTSSRRGECHKCKQIIEYIFRPCRSSAEIRKIQAVIINDIKKFQKSLNMRKNEREYHREKKCLKCHKIISTIFGTDDFDKDGYKQDEAARENLETECDKREPIEELLRVYSKKLNQENSNKHITPQIGVPIIDPMSSKTCEKDVEININKKTNETMTISRTKETEHEGLALKTTPKLVDSESIKLSRHETGITLSTTDKQTEEQLAQKVEKIEETSLVQAEPSKIADFNTPPRVLSHKGKNFHVPLELEGRNKNFVDSNVVRIFDQIVGKMHNAKKNNGISAVRCSMINLVNKNSNLGGNADRNSEEDKYDAIAKKYIGTPNDLIDFRLIREIKLLADPSIKIRNPKKPLRLQDHNIDLEKSINENKYILKNKHTNLHDAENNNSSIRLNLRAQGIRYTENFNYDQAEPNKLENKLHLVRERKLDAIGSVQDKLINKYWDSKSTRSYSKRKTKLSRGSRFWIAKHPYFQQLLSNQQVNDDSTHKLDSQNPNTKYYTEDKKSLRDMYCRPYDTQKNLPYKKKQSFEHLVLAPATQNIPGESRESEFTRDKHVNYMGRNQKHSLRDIITGDVPQESQIDLQKINDNNSLYKSHENVWNTKENVNPVCLSREQNPIDNIENEQIYEPNSFKFSSLRLPEHYRSGIANAQIILSTNESNKQGLQSMKYIKNCPIYDAHKPIAEDDTLNCQEKKDHYLQISKNKPLNPQSLNPQSLSNYPHRYERNEKYGEPVISQYCTYLDYYNKKTESYKKGSMLNTHEEDNELKCNLDKPILSPYDKNYYLKKTEQESSEDENKIIFEPVAQRQRPEAHAKVTSFLCQKYSHSYHYYTQLPNYHYDPYTGQWVDRCARFERPTRQFVPEYWRQQNSYFPGHVAFLQQYEMYNANKCYCLGQNRHNCTNLYQCPMHHPYYHAGFYNQTSTPYSEQPRQYHGRWNDYQRGQEKHVDNCLFCSNHQSSEYVDISSDQNYADMKLKLSKDPNKFLPKHVVINEDVTAENKALQQKYVRGDQINASQVSDSYSNSNRFECPHHMNEPQSNSKNPKSPPVAPAAAFISLPQEQFKLQSTELPVSSLTEIETLHENLPLSEILRRVRERSRLECLSILRELKPKGKCGKKRPPCPPPPPQCPKAKPSAPPPCPPPPPPCPRPCKPRCPHPCKPTKPKCPPSPPRCKFESIPIGDALYHIFTQIWDFGMTRFVHRRSFPSYEFVTYSAKSITIEQIDYKLQILSTNLFQICGPDIGSYCSKLEILVHTRGFEPWVPIPSWPFPVQEEKKKLVCPKEGCKVRLPPKFGENCDQPCSPGEPCKGFPNSFRKN